MSKGGIVKIRMFSIIQTNNWIAILQDREFREMCIMIGEKMYVFASFVWCMTFCLVKIEIRKGYTNKNL